MANEEDISIRVEGEQAEAELTALAQNVAVLENELSRLKNTTGVTNVEIDSATKRLAAAKEEYKATSEEVKKLNSTNVEHETKTKSLTDKYATLAVRLFGARQVLMSLGEAMKSVAQATGTYSGATKDAIDEVGNLASSIASLDLVGASKALGQLAGQTVAWAQGLNEANIQLGSMADRDAAGMFAGILAIQRGLVAGHEAETAALDRKAQALSREIEVQTNAGNVQKFLRDEVLSTLEAYAKAGEQVPTTLAAQAEALGIVTKAQEETAKSAAELESSSIKSADARSKAEAKAADEIVASLERQRLAIAAQITQSEKALADKLAKGAGVDTSQDATEAQKGLEDLNKEVRDLESQPILSSEQLNQLDDLKNKAADAKNAIGDLNTVFTVTADNFLTEAEAADAAASAWDVYRGLLDQAQLEHDAVMDGIEGVESSLSEVGNSAVSAGESLSDVASAAGSIGDEGSKGADKANEGLGKLSEGADEVIPKLETIKGLLVDIVTLGSQADI